MHSCNRYLIIFDSKLDTSGRYWYGGSLMAKIKNFNAWWWVAPRCAQYFLVGPVQHCCVQDTTQIISRLLWHLSLLSITDYKNNYFKTRPEMNLKLWRGNHHYCAHIHIDSISHRTYPINVFGFRWTNPLQNEVQTNENNAIALNSPADPKDFVRAHQIGTKHCTS